MHEENKESHSTTLLLNTKTLAYRMVFRCVTIHVKSLRLFKQQSASTLSAMDLPFNQPLCKKILISVWTKIYPTVFLSQAGNSDNQSNFWSIPVAWAAKGLHLCGYAGPQRITVCYCHCNDTIWISFPQLSKTKPGKPYCQLLQFWKTNFFWQLSIHHINFKNL